MIISVVQQKGGVGKTTISLHLAMGLHLRGFKTALIDADEQRSASYWSAKRGEAAAFPVMSMAKATLHRELLQLADSFDFIIIDGPPRHSEILRSAMAASDLALIPVKASSFDVWAASEVIKVVREIQTVKPAMKAAFVINELRPNTRLARDIRAALTAQETPVLDAAVHLRQAFSVAVGRGLTVFESEPSGKASEDMNSVITEVIQLLKEDEQ